ncbi:hypothetical protein SPRG_03571 [Saprolegnia parasitica CBS 223.65]|uniref:WW domain-containing protein n=1 Tax=Saprolegnia parasitica (strain CBS 223.65) TaxID=695850 RepID=A0A067CYR6_SAPPC|nr:hypothetical protein SPRG_03571 [Saprolegnia parasitica CBS 223.65]KDO31651.1 hypothetical protein SPRG_03571 [Saprolegnia parasitica CBS 223.65]|eukprot:XP_012197541.1 hypothetical protein SPRG_03571 [Saprolegnia parasitica CBS 223.65]
MAAWDLRGLGTKYPWLTVNDATLADFREPFEWTRDEDVRSKPRTNAAREAGRKMVLAHSRDKVTDAVVLKELPQRTRPKAAIDSLDAIVHETKTLVCAKPWQAPVLELTSRKRQTATMATRKEAPTSRRLHAARQVAENDESHLRTLLAQQIEAQRATLPLTFLFEHNMTEYCRAKGVATIMAVFSKLQNKYLDEGLRRWKHHTTSLRAAETKARVHAQMQTRAVQLLERVAGGCLLGNLRTAYTRWVDTTRALVAAERNRAAIRIQVHVKRRRDMAVLSQLKLARDARQARDAQLVLDLLRFEATGYAQLWMIRRQATAIRDRQAIEAQLYASCAIAIQRRYRGHRTRRSVRELRIARHEAELARVQAEHLYLATLHAAAIVMQSAVRVYLAKIALYDARMRARIRSENALIIQHAWRTSKGQKVLATRFAKRQLTLAEQAERERYLAKQRLLAEIEAKRQAAATTIQRLARGILGRRRAQSRRYEIALDAAARQVQASWRKSTGRFALHLRFLAQKERLAARRLDAAVCIQCAFRCFDATKRVGILRRERQARHEKAARQVAWARKQVESALRIQCLYRGYRVRAHLAASHAAATSIQCMVRQHFARAVRRRREADLRRRQAQQHAAAVTIQRIQRGRMGRRRAKAQAEAQRIAAEERQRSASRIQSRLRGNQSRSSLRALHRAQQIVLTQQRRTTRRVPSPLAKLLSSLPLSALTLAHVAAIDTGIEAATLAMQHEDRAVTRIQCLYRGRNGRFAYHLLLEAKYRRDLLEAASATHIQRRVRGRIGRALVAKVRARKQHHETALAYKRSLAAREAKDKWLMDVDMEKFRAEVEKERALEHALRIARAEADLARAQAEALELQQRIADANKQMADAKASAWDEVTDNYGYVYYSNRLTGETSWEIPSEMLRVRAAKKADDAPPKIPDAWEELYNPNTGQMYFHNRATGETKWTPTGDASPARDATTIAPPKEPEPVATPSTPKPSTPKPATPEPATPQPATSAVPEATKRLCWRCKKASAVKECVQCPSPNVAYCSSCFVKEHRAETKRTHDFKPLQANGTREHAMCQHCDAFATYHCAACDAGTRFSCDDCFHSRHATAEGLTHKPLHFSSSASLCSHCPASERCVAQRICHDCHDKFCSDCAAAVHASGKKKLHTIELLNVLKVDLGPLETYCIRCDVDVAVRLCNLCGDSFCVACYELEHARGRKADHTYILCKDAATAGDWVEIFDEKRGGHLYYNLVTKETVEAKPSVLLLGLERHRDGIAESLREKKKKELERESELVALREAVNALQEEKELERRYREQQAILEDNPDVLTTKPKRAWWKSKAQVEKEKKEREDKVVMALLVTSQRKAKLHQEAMEMGSPTYATAILDSVIQ